MKLFRIISIFIVFISTGILSDPFLHIAGGTNFSFITYNDSTPDSRETRIGHNWGIGFEQNFTTHFSLITSFSFETRGQNETNTVEGTNVTKLINDKVRMYYLQVPILGQFNLPLGSVFAVNVFGGPDLGVSLTAEKMIKRKITQQNGDVAIENDTINLAKNMEMLDFGVSIGIGCELKIGTGALFLRPDLYVGLTNFSKGNRGGDDDKIYKGKHGNIRVTIGYKFGLPVD